MTANIGCEKDVVQIMSEAGRVQRVTIRALSNGGFGQNSKYLL